MRDTRRDLRVGIPQHPARPQNPGLSRAEAGRRKPLPAGRGRFARTRRQRAELRATMRPMRRRIGIAVSQRPAHHLQRVMQQRQPVEMQQSQKARLGPHQIAPFATVIAHRLMDAEKMPPPGPRDRLAEVMPRQPDIQHLHCLAVIDGASPGRKLWPGQAERPIQKPAGRCPRLGDQPHALGHADMHPVGAPAREAQQQRHRRRRQAETAHRHQELVGVAMQHPIESRLRQHPAGMILLSHQMAARSPPPVLAGILKSPAIGPRIGQHRPRNAGQKIARFLVRTVEQHMNLGRAQLQMMRNESRDQRPRLVDQRRNAPAVHLLRPPSRIRIAAQSGRFHPLSQGRPDSPSSPVASLPHRGAGPRRVL